MDSNEIRDIRTSYERGILTKDDLLSDPKEMMKQWLEVAITQDALEPTAMTLSTVDVDNQPSSRTILLKEIDDGFVFYTNYHSKKADDIEANDRVALLFFWKELERQVRIQGRIEKISEEQSIAYFKSRPKGSQLGAWASPQSKVIVDRNTLDDRLAELSDVYKDREDLPKPAHWGGYRVLGDYYEFWQGRKNRLHDRFSFTFVNEDWVINRLGS